MISKIKIRNFKSIIDTEIEFKDSIYILAGQNEAGKSSILEALETFQKKILNRDNLNFEEENKGNLEQVISVTYVVDDTFHASLIEALNKLINQDMISAEDSIDYIDIIKIAKIKQYTITRTFDFSNDKAQIYIGLDTFTRSIIKTAINSKKTVVNSSEDKTVSLVKPYIDFDGKQTEISQTFFKLSPKIILFNDFRDLLPDNIKVKDLEDDNEDAKGIDAVRNLESLLSLDFSTISKKKIAQKNASIDSESKAVSASFQQDWKQKIYDNNEVKIKFFIENNDDGERTISFYIQTKDNVFLEPRKRSKGMIWFLSLWLELKAQENENKLILLFDEPGLHLHVKANNDMINVIKKLAEKGHQIIYTTHVPSLIDTDKLYNIGLVLNTPDKGTIVEGLTTSRLNTANKRDALQPVAEAMGLEPLKDFSVLSTKNVIVEGLSDFWYFRAMSKILNIKQDYKFVPGIGVKSSKLFPLLSFCIGYGLDWLLIMDGGEVPKSTYKELENFIFFNDDNLLKKKVKLLDYNEVEDMFNVADFSLIDSKIKSLKPKLTSEIIGSRKIVFAKDFYRAVQEGIITKNNIQEQTIKNFEEIFSFIKEGFK